MVMGLRVPIRGLLKSLEAVCCVMCHVSFSLNSLKGGYIGIIYGTTIGVIKGDTRSLDYSSCDP